MTETFTEYDPAEYLRDEEAIKIFIADALETGNAEYIAHALGVAARAKGMQKIANQTELAREQLYKSFSKQGNPTLKSVMAMLKALDIRLTIAPFAA